MKKPLILITNDDGITSKGIFELVSAVKDLGEIIVVAPDGPQSGKGHAITVGETLRVKKNQIFKDIEAYECSGTPADCVKLAKHQILKGRRVDLGTEWCKSWEQYFNQRFIFGYYGSCD